MVGRKRVHRKPWASVRAGASEGCLTAETDAITALTKDGETEARRDEDIDHSLQACRWWSWDPAGNA